jgi:hypothetical protein
LEARTFLRVASALQVGCLPEPILLTFCVYGVELLSCRKVGVRVVGAYYPWFAMPGFKPPPYMMGMKGIREPYTTQSSCLEQSLYNTELERGKRNSCGCLSRGDN